MIVEFVQVVILIMTQTAIKMNVVHVLETTVHVQVVQTTQLTTIMMDVMILKQMNLQIV